MPDPFDHIEIVDLGGPLFSLFYEDWLAHGKQAEMDYLKDHLGLKNDPRQILASAKSILIATRRYHPHPHGAGNPFPHLTSAKYAQGDDYHHWFFAELLQLANQLQADHPDLEFRVGTDSLPIFERDWAYQAGAGWIGKNTCLIHPKRGSFFFIGEILLSKTRAQILQTAQPAPARLQNFCGNCDRCIRACPTGALTESAGLDARKCIAFWNIESRTIAPQELRPLMGDHFFGCDICQDVCPWNIRFADLAQPAPATGHDEEMRAEELRFLLTASHKQIEKKVKNSPLARAKPAGLKRNALVVIGNKKMKALLPEVLALQDQEAPKAFAKKDWQDLLAWTLSNLRE